MRLSGVRAIVLLVAATAASTSAFQLPARPAGSPAWPPPVQPADAAAPLRTPEEEMKTFVLPPGYRVELVASEPMVEEPISSTGTPSGRMWVVEMLGYMQDIACDERARPTGRVSVLEDTNDDGRMDKKTVFLDGLVLPRALKVLERRRARRRAAEPLARARHQRRPQGRHEGSWSLRHATAGAMANVEHNAEQPALGDRQLDAHVGDTTRICG